MFHTYKIDYRSGIESLQIADSAVEAWRAECADAGVPFEAPESTFSGGDWDIAVYDAALPYATETTDFFVLARPDDELYRRSADVVPS